MEESSPRSKFIKKKFANFENDEIVLDNFACAFASSRILLQGMLYLTNRACYFYSPFNVKTLLGQGSKIKIPLVDLKSIKKETSFLVFPNALRFIFKSGEQILF
jgi:GRAM domain